MMLSTSLRLELSHGNARIGVQSTPGKWDMQQPHADMEITQKPAVLTIDQGPGQLDLDLYTARRALGFKKTGDMLADVAGQTKQIVLEAIGRIVEDGNQMAAIQNHRNVVADLALEHQDLGPMPIQDVDPGSYNPVGIHYQPHETQLHWEVRGTEIHATPHAAITNYTPGKVDVYLDQKNWLQIDVKGQYMNREF
ncbi:hypothetical protein JJB07_02540 [Tumebacillus sp. ITR2]|uniref:Uncharacterized protein n=1 Tax=Tumebacillus amylolyticus TaxID=2801339 RepID=A0ABS1J5E8_9BACL|nr:DUF6470 family protein [Tumebacillus amylolyticus]MBL0385516.1 hypothetical protein [Tumebacillus amylolyticus]